MASKESVIRAKQIVKLNEKRNKEKYKKCNPITGECALGKRFVLHLDDHPIPTQYCPAEMLDNNLVKQLKKAGSLHKFITDKGHEPTRENRISVICMLIRIRVKYDFPYWAASYAFIKPKGGGDDIRFKLNNPQTTLIEEFERQRTLNGYVRLILLKARQWGGSTATQIYMLWLQLVHQVGLNSLIVGHVKDAANEVKDMCTRLLNNYPMWLLHEHGDSFDEKEPKFTGVNASPNINRIPQRNCKVKIGTAEMPNSARGGDYNLVHCTEVGLWKKTEGKSPEDIIRSACSGVLLKPYTMIVYESTANGTGNFFHREWVAATKGENQLIPLFIPWYVIENYELPIDNHQEFAQKLIDNRDNEYAPSEREEPGKYLFWLWEKGATLEAINWYIAERKKYRSHADFAAEYPSDDIEAFAHSGDIVFDKYCVANLEATCVQPRAVGELAAKAMSGEDALTDLHFSPDATGRLEIWDFPEYDEECYADYRYLAVVDIGGRSNKADYSVITVFDRIWQAEGGKPSVVAQWYGHDDMDRIAWKAAQIAQFYGEALLVIESNTIETHDKERSVDGDQSLYLLNQIKDVYTNLYEREQSEDEIRMQAPKKYGFHTNVATKPVIISNLIQIVRDGMYTERDAKVLAEYNQYERKPNGAFGAVSGAHDDLLMTRAIGLYIAYHKMPLPVWVTPKTRKITKKKTISEASL